MYLNIEIPQTSYCRTFQYAGLLSTLVYENVRGWGIYSKNFIHILYTVFCKVDTHVQHATNPW
jgi:hypothetical protein